ncbi:hypothetical protein CEXT_642641 [Caerostris extrusa]|uniref:Uncharacterized protein n=1 Tax=Caerostris extrusa TaxID=172846 RepID=A0AAV4RBG2_CAEEX|nr:hypothetical protein CEXT_642641 [Caerostris extrusa]
MFETHLRGKTIKEKCSHSSFSGHQRPAPDLKNKPQLAMGRKKIGVYGRGAEDKTPLPLPCKVLPPSTPTDKSCCSPN